MWNDSGIMVPVGNHYIEANVLKVRQLFKEYDERLDLVFNQITNEWAAAYWVDRNQLHIVINFGHVLPEADTAMQKVREFDTLRNPGIYDEMKKRNLAKLDAGNKRIEETSGEIAEAFDWLFRKTGTHPFPRIFVPRGV